MSDELKETPRPGSVIRYAAWNGVVLDVFKSETSDKHILQIMFAKNVYKQQPAELHIYEDLKSGLLRRTLDHFGVISICGNRFRHNWILALGSRLGCHNLAHLLKASMCQCISGCGGCLSKDRPKAGAKVAVIGEA